MKNLVIFLLSERIEKNAAIRAENSAHVAMAYIKLE